MGLRTAAHVEEEYNAARVAYLQALDAEKLEFSSGGTSRSLQRTSSTDLKKQMEGLAKEYSRLSRGSSMKSYSIVPED